MAAESRACRRGRLGHPSVPGYAQLDTRLGWNVTRSLQLSMSGCNLPHARHLEFLEGGISAEVPVAFLSRRASGFDGGTCQQAKARCVTPVESSGVNQGEMNEGGETRYAKLYNRSMHTFASIAIGLLMFATIAVLFAGLIGMVRGQSGAASNKLMRYRVLLQGATLLLLVIFMSLLRS